ncbi:MAG: hypothetical protein L6Q84_04415 [Polyangiaceae bacterium]|nr:hypothetical protein [Polyangiaceae bacterium]
MRAWPSAFVILTLASVAAAAPSATERTLARELFEQGRKLMADKDYPKACAKLAESQRLDPAPGTLLNLAVCHEAEGKTATAWAEFNDALSLAKRDGRKDRIDLATQHLADLEPRLSRLTIEVPAASRLSGLEIELDGSRVGRPAWGSGVPVDPGTHQVTARAPGWKDWQAEITLGDRADRKTITVPALQKASTKVGEAPEKRKPAARDVGTGSGQRTTGYVVGGLGIVALGVGGYFGLRAYSRWDDRNAHCTDAGCDPTGVDAGDDAKQAATIANIGVGVGAAALATGVILVLTAGPSERAAASVTPDGRGMTLRYQRSF